MCVHACSFHKKKGGHRTPCCVSCSCGENIELTKMDLHLADCHCIGLDIPRTPINRPTPPSAHKSVPAYARAA